MDGKQQIMVRVAKWLLMKYRMAHEEGAAFESGA